MVPYSFKFLSCSGSGANDSCDVQSYYSGHPFQRGRSTYPQVLNLLPRCHLQTPAEAQADARSASIPPPNAAANQGGAGPGGFKVGDSVRILSDGWQEAQIIQVHGASYVVHLPNGVDVSKRGKVVFYKAGSFQPFDYDFDINNDGTLQSPLGAIKKMGN
jgi:hypothetical protein